MITFLTVENNTLSQSFYNSCIARIQFHQLTCSCGHSGCLKIHGYYQRKVKTREGSFMLHVCRLICSECGDVNSACTDFPEVDENNVKSIIHRFRRHWLERLRSFRIDLDPIRMLVLKCFSFYSMQFMQIHRTVNRLHPQTT